MRNMAAPSDCTVKYISELQIEMWREPYLLLHRLHYFGSTNYDTCFVYHISGLKKLNVFPTQRNGFFDVLVPNIPTALSRNTQM